MTFEDTQPSLEGLETAPSPVALAVNKLVRVKLRDYQLQAVESARAELRLGKKSVLIVSPTGSGKTVIAAHLIEECVNKGRRVTFIVDRLSLIEQTSKTLDSYGIDHGVIQADHWRRRRHLPVQIASVQTLLRRGIPDCDLVIVDEAHSLHKTVTTHIKSNKTVTLGLTATPFTKGLNEIYKGVVNVTTTNKLLADGWLSPFRIFACTEPDLTGVKVKAGEWDENEAGDRALQVVGDVVQEYLDKGQSRKFMCSAVNVAHVEELHRQFTAAGIPTATFTYKDLEEDRFETVVEFKKHDSSIRGLITVSAASKGFDCPDVSCLIFARPLRKSLAEFIQFFGRGLRICPETGKVDCLILDHSGNFARFWHQWTEFFELGALSLAGGEKKEKEAKKPDDQVEKEPVKCPACGSLHAPMPHCPSCGHEYPKKAAIQHVPGTLKELVACGDKKLLRDKIWPQVCGYVLKNTPDIALAQRKAQGIFKELTGDFAPAKIEFTTPIEPSPEIYNKILGNSIRWAKRKAKYGAAA